MEGRDPKASTRHARSAWTAPTAERDSLIAPQPRRPSGHRPLRRSHPFSLGGPLHRAARTRALADGMESATTAARAQSTRTAPSGPTASTAARGLHVESTPPGLPLRPLPLRRRRRFSQMEAQGCARTPVPPPITASVTTHPAMDATCTTQTTKLLAAALLTMAVVPTLRPSAATTTRGSTTRQQRTTASVRMAALERSTHPALWATIVPTADNVRLLHRHPRHCHRRRRHRPRRHRHRRHRHRRRRHRRHRHLHRHRRHRHRRHPRRHHLLRRRHPSHHRHDPRRRIRVSSASRRAVPRGGRRAAPRTHGHANLGARPPQTPDQAALPRAPFTSSQRQTASRTGIPTISTMTARRARGGWPASPLRTA